MPEGSKLAEAYVRVRGDMRDLRSDMGRIRGFLRMNVGSLQRMVSGLLRPLKILTSPLGMLGIGAGAVGAIALTKKLIDKARAQEDAERKLAAALKATGYAVGFSTKELRDYANELQKVSNYGDEAILPMMAILATFKEIKGETFKEASKVILDMATLLGQDLKAGALQVGKALNEPVRGAAALRDVGVSITEQQMEQIKTLAKQNKLYEAQQIILKELVSEFGGAAEALADPITQLKNQFGDALEELGGQLLPFVRVGAEELKARLTELTGKKSEIGGLADEFGILGAAIIEAAKAMQELHKNTLGFAVVMAQVKLESERRVGPGAETMMKALGKTPQGAVLNRLFGVDPEKMGRDFDEWAAENEKKAEKHLEKMQELLQKAEAAPDWGAGLAKRARDMRAVMDQMRGEFEKKRQDIAAAMSMELPEDIAEMLTAPMEGAWEDWWEWLPKQKKTKESRGAITGIADVSRTLQVALLNAPAERRAEKQAQDIGAIREDMERGADAMEELAKGGVGVFGGGYV